MQPNRALGVLAVLLALGALAVWQFGFRREPGAPPAAGTGGPSNAAPERAGVEQPGQPAPASAEQGDGGGERVAVATASVQDDRKFALLGQVVGPQGRPLAGARVIAAPGLGFATATGELDLTSFDPRDLADFDPASLDDAGRQLEQRVEVTTDPEGRFRLQPPGATSGVGLRVLARGCAILDRRAGRPVDGDVDVGILALESGVVVAGRVLDARGEPVAGARVTRVSEAEERMLGAMDLDVPGASRVEERDGEASVTDSAGRFELAHLTAGELTLRARHADHPTARSARLTAKAGAELRDVVVTMRGGAQISGRVLGMPEDGKDLRVVAAARPKVDGESGMLDLFGTEVSELLAAAGMAIGERSAAVASDGSFVLRGLGAGDYRIWLANVHQGNAGSAICSEQREVASGASDVALRYEPGVSVFATVVDARSGAPVERLWVRDRLVGGVDVTDLVAELREAVRARSYPGGKVAVANLRPKAKQTLSLTIEATGYGPVERADIALPATGTVDLGTIELEPKPVLQVTVVEADTGAAIPAATVRLESPQHGAASPFGRRWGRLGGGSGPAAGKTDSEGRCALNSFVNAVGVIEVDCARFAPLVSEEISFPETGVGRYTARLHVGGQVVVTVHGPDGKPVKDAVVEHRSPVSDIAHRRTSADGLARFQRLAPGTHSFRLAKDGPMGLVFAPMRQAQRAPEIPWQTVDVVDRAEATLLLTKLPSASLRGVVRENGQPLMGGRVAFAEGAGPDQQHDMAASMMGAMLGRRGRSAKVGDDGSYTLVELPEGQHRLRVTHRARAMPAYVAVQLQNGDNVLDIELETTTVRGVVLDPGGNPVEGARVRVRRAPKAGDSGADSGGDFAQLVGGLMPELHDMDGGPSVKTDATGAFELRGVEGDVELQVRATAKGFAPAAVTAKAERGTTHARVELWLGAAGRIQVSIPSAADSLLGSVKASFVDASAGVTPVEQRLRKGKCTLEALRPGAWRVEYSSGDKPLVRIVEVAAGETAKIEL